MTETHIDAATAADWRTRLGLSADASAQDIVDAVSAHAAAHNGPAIDPDNLPEGTTLVDSAALQQLQADIAAAREWEATNNQREAAARADRVINAAVAQGKFAPAQRPTYEKLLALDPEGTEKAITALADNVVPVTELGYSTDAGRTSNTAAMLDAAARQLGLPTGALTEGAHQ